MCLYAYLAWKTHICMLPNIPRSTRRYVDSRAFYRMQQDHHTTKSVLAKLDIERRRCTMIFWIDPMTNATVFGILGVVEHPSICTFAPCLRAFRQTMNQWLIPNRDTPKYTAYDLQMEKSKMLRYSTNHSFYDTKVKDSNGQSAGMWSVCLMPYNRYIITTINKSAQRNAWLIFRRNIHTYV